MILATAKLLQQYQQQQATNLRSEQQRILRPKKHTAQPLAHKLKFKTWLETKATTALVAEAGPFGLHLAYNYLRYYYQVLWLLHRLVAKPAKLPDLVRLLLLIALVALRHANKPSHAVVNSAVAAVKTMGWPKLTGLVNAVLRQYLRTETELMAELLATEPAAYYGYPAWLWQSLLASYPEAAQLATVAEASNIEAPLSLRVNLSQVTKAEFCQAVQAQNLLTQPLVLAGEELAAGLMVEPVVPVPTLPGYESGWFVVQDGASQIALESIVDCLPEFLDVERELVDAEQTYNILDACAAPGGKLLHLVDLVAQRVKLAISVKNKPSSNNQPNSSNKLTATIKLTACDISAKRLEVLRANLARCHSMLDQANIELQLMVADLLALPTEVPAWDLIILDAPCSATGIIRRQPDIKLQLQAEQLTELCQQQQALLRHAWRLLKPGGYLLYMTCSILSMENSEQIAKFLVTVGMDQAKLVVEQQLLPGKANIAAEANTAGANIAGSANIAGEANIDGFYFAKLYKLI